MAGLSDDKIAVLRQLVLNAPDPVIRGLQSVLAEDVAPVGALASVRAMVEREAADRLVRNVALAPVEPLFGAPAGEGRLTFPRHALGLVWRGLKAERPDLVRKAAARVEGGDPRRAAPGAFDDLCGQAAQGVRAAIQPDFAAAAAVCEAARPDGAEALAACLDLAPIVRPALADLGRWVLRMTQERTAAVRLAYRDAVAVADDAGPRFFEMLAGHLEQPWLILRLISAVMDKPTERYLSSSELASFGERVLADIDRRIGQVRSFDPAGGIDAGRRAAAAVHAASEAISEFETSIQLQTGGPWSPRVAKLRKALASVVEARLKETEDHLGAALPTHALRFGARLVKKTPRLTDDPGALAVGRTQGLLAFADEVRGSASSGGFGSTRAKVLESLDKRLDLYIEDLLDLLRAGDCEDPDRARRFLEVAAGFMAFCRDERAAQIVRRRAAAA